MNRSPLQNGLKLLTPNPTTSNGKNKMNIKENIKKLKLNTYTWKCPKCGDVIGPSMTKKGVIELAEKHIEEEHEGE